MLSHCQDKPGHLEGGTTSDRLVGSHCCQEGSIEIHRTDSLIETTSEMFDARTMHVLPRKRATHTTAMHSKAVHTALIGYYLTLLSDSCQPAAASTPLSQEPDTAAESPSR